MLYTEKLVPLVALLDMASVLLPCSVLLSVSVFYAVSSRNVGLCPDYTFCSEMRRSVTFCCLV